MTKLEKYISTYFDVLPQEMEKISAFFEPLALRKGEYYLRSGRHDLSNRNSCNSFRFH
ncbi:MAG: hypothetical protein H7Y03_03850 [Chitinophagaceae bacterium]|nr:hypothetical protein [Chitinophagaceae bacterium]